MSTGQKNVSQRLVHTPGMCGCYPCRLLAKKKLPLKWPESVSQEHFQEMNLALQEEGSSTAGMSIRTVCRLNALPNAILVAAAKLCKPKLIPSQCGNRVGAVPPAFLSPDETRFGTLFCQGSCVTGGFHC